MRTLLAIVVSTLAIALVPNSAFAQTSSGSAATTITPARNLMRSNVSMSPPASASISARRMAFKEQMEIIQDSRKQALIDKIDMRMNAVNDTQAQKWTMGLDTLQNILTRIKTQGTALASEGRSTVALDAATASAQTAITTAQAAVTAQGEKDYVITIASSAALRSPTLTTISQLRADLRATKRTVDAARLAVAGAAAELVKLNGAGARQDMPASNPARMMMQ